MLKAGQTLLLNNRLWNLRQVHRLDERKLALEAIGASEASLGMTRPMKAIQYGREIFIEQGQGGYWQADLDRDWVEGERGPALKCRAATRLDLLAAHTRHPARGDLKHQFSWSYSRAARYGRCPRAYYYHYYAAWEGWRKEAPQPVRQAYLLKNLTNLSLWVGALVHETIKFAMARLKAGRPVADDNLIRQMHRRAQRDFDDSESGHYRQKPQQLTGFQEHYYKTDLSKTSLQKARIMAEGYIRTFLNSSLYARLQGQPPASFLDVETLQSFPIAGTNVWVQMDLARYEEDTIYLYDWKSGGSAFDEAAVRQQLGIYGLYLRRANPEWATAPIRGIVFALAQNRLLEFDLDQAALQAAQAFIEASIAQLQGLLLDPKSNLAQMRRFPMIDDLQICRGCQFRELCGR